MPASARRWLLFVHQLPSRPSNIRVRVWRRLQQIGALVIKQAVYVLPDSADAREDFEWLKAEIEGGGGQASILSADHIDGAEDGALIEEFRHARQEDYAALAREIETSLTSTRATATRRGRGHRRHRPVQALRQRLTAIERIDFFASAGRDRVVALIEQMASRHSPARHVRQSDGTGSRAAAYRARLWVTRPRPGVDRMASAWLIRRFIDPEARFKFVAGREYRPEAGELRYDMFEAEFTHEGDRCTFEGLVRRFALEDGALREMAEIVHDVDLKDAKFSRPEAPGLERLVAGIAIRHEDDEARLRDGALVLEALYEYFRKKG